MRASKGQSLAEMALGTALVAIVLIPVLSVLGGLTNDIFGNALQNNPKPVVASVPIQTTPAPTADPGTVSPVTPPVPVTPVAGAPGSVSVTLADGTVLTMPNYPNNISNIVETTGANGATDVMLAQLDAMLAQLQASGNADPETVSRLQELSNLGHRMANAEALVENALAAHPDANDFNNQTFTFEGVTYTAEEFSQMFGWHMVVPSTLTDATTTANAKGYLADFLQAYQDAVDSGTLNDPALNTVVTDLVGKVGSMSEYVENAIWNVVSIGASPISEQANISSNSSHLDSTGICYAGGGSDSGVQCH
ncbi:MAG: hypothetical protein AB7P76_07775 [Candidatus Melainabacteria bacterium]